MNKILVLVFCLFIQIVYSNNLDSTNDDTSDVEIPVAFKSNGFVIYHNIDLKMTWQEAKEKCESAGRRLFELHNSFDKVLLNDYLTHTLGDATHFVWLGARRLNSDDEFKWINGDFFDTILIEPYYTHRLENGNCFQAKGVIDWGHLEWNIRDCEMKENFICVKEESFDEIEIPLAYESNGYSLYHTRNQKMNWEDANRKCKSDGRYLFETRNDVEYSILDEYLKSIDFPSFQHVWLGGKRENSNDDLKWSTGDKVSDEILYKHSVEYAEEGNCSKVHRMWTNLKWTVQDCMTQIDFICVSKAGS